MQAIRARRLGLTVLAIGVVGGAAGALAQGQFNGTDILHYHVYNGYAFLTGRVAQDLAPSGPASFFNPLMDAVHYVGIRYVPSMLLTALLGALHGLNVFLIWSIARATLHAQPTWLVALATFLGATGQSGISLLGTVFGDNVASLFALLGLWILLPERNAGPGRVALAGVAGGAAVGLKLTLAVAHVGLSIVAVLVAWRARRPLLLLAFALGSLAGWGVIDGWWAWTLWSRFDNPIFPYFNDIFRSPFWGEAFLRDERWAARGALDWLLAPLHATLGGRGLQEVSFRDPRLLLGALGVVAAGVAWLREPRSFPPDDPRRAAHDLATYWAVSYAAWVIVFHYYRYAIVLEMLAPALLLSALVPSWPRVRRPLAVAVAVLTLGGTRVGDWARSHEWSPRWFEGRVPALVATPDSLVLLPERATSFTVPFFPQSASFIGLSHYVRYGPALREAVSSRIAGHRGPLFALTRERSRESEVLRGLGLRAVDECAPLRLRRLRAPRLELCPLRRLDEE